MSKKALLQILSDGQNHTEVNLGQMLAISLSELRQLVQELIGQGLKISATNESVYSLPHAIVLLSDSRIIANMPINIRDSLNAFDVFLEVDSTNAVALRYLKNGGQGMALFVAEQQNMGRGRRGNNWISPIASNIYLSFVWTCPGSVQAIEGLSPVTAISLVKTLQDSSLIGMEKLQVKWPNDVWLDNKKLAGILLEFYQGNGGFNQVIIGIGLNVRMPLVEFEEISHFATDLASHGNLSVDRNLIIARLVEQLQIDLGVFMSQGFTAFKNQWQQLDRFHQQNVEVTSGVNKISGKVKGLSSTGALLLETNEGDKLIMGGEMAPSIRAS